MPDLQERYPPIADYAVISNCSCAALVSRAGSIDWCCMPRLDDDSCFGRILDWDKGGYFLLAPHAQPYQASRRYLPDTMILETVFDTADGSARLIDFFAMDGGAAGSPVQVRLIEGLAGALEIRAELCPRFDYGEIAPHIERSGAGHYMAIGSNKGLLIHSDLPLAAGGNSALHGTIRLCAGQRLAMTIRFEPPERIEQAAPPCDTEAAWRALEETRRWWQAWAGRIGDVPHIDAQTRRSAIILKSLACAETGAIAAAMTTSLPEWVGGERNWDYRFSWIRDSAFVVRVLHELGYQEEAAQFHHFIMRSAAGKADELQIMFAVDGKRRLPELELDWLEGYRSSRPVRIGNRAAGQHQADMYGELLQLACEGCLQGQPIGNDYWRFLREVVDTVCRRWREPDHGIWEVRGEPRHYVYSKVMCWVAVDRGLALALDLGLDAPVERWRQARADIRATVEREGYHEQAGIFVQSFGADNLDAALLLMPRVGFIADDDPRMVRTVRAIRARLGHRGLVRRYEGPDALPGPEGLFLPCAFWLATCLACQGQEELARQHYAAAAACANDVGLYSEEYDIDAGQMLGNIPQALTHVSQITAQLALARAMPDAAAATGN